MKLLTLRNTLLWMCVFDIVYGISQCEKENITHRQTYPLWAEHNFGFGQLPLVRTTLLLAVCVMTIVKRGKF